jgi:hypothetical protein
MWIYLIVFFIPLLFFFADNKKNRSNSTVLFVYFLFLALFVGVSDMLGGYDRYIYSELFDGLADDIREGRNPFLSIGFLFYGGEKGYGLLTIIIAFLTSNRYIFIFIVTLVIYAMLFISIKRYTKDHPVAVMLFLGLWFFFTFTYLRQVLGATIAWLSIRYIVKRDFWRFVLVWFIAYMFHNSALIFLPFYFVPIKKFNPQHVVLAMLLCFIIGLSNIPLSLFESYSAISSQRSNAEGYVLDAGFRGAYMIEAVVFLFLILKPYKRIKEDPQEIVLLNMALGFCAILLLFAKSENGGRLSWYYMIGIVATLSNITLRYKRSSAYSLGVALLSFMLFLRITISWGVLLRPYKTFFTNGVREGDYIEQSYEYDHGYDRDKFYRK